MIPVLVHGLYLLLVARSTDKAERSSMFVLLFITVERAYGFGNVVARVGYRELAGMTASAGKAAANMSAGSRCGL